MARRGGKWHSDRLLNKQCSFGVKKSVIQSICLLLHNSFTKGLIWAQESGLLCNSERVVEPCFLSASAMLLLSPLCHLCRSLASLLRSDLQISYWPLLIHRLIITEIVVIFQQISEYALKASSI